MANYYNRYVTLNDDETIISPPFIKLDEKSTDDFVVYDINKSRLDKISVEKYGAPYYGWLILLANPEIGGSEYKILDGQTIRIPLPLDVTLIEYKNKLRQKLDYYG